MLHPSKLLKQEAEDKTESEKTQSTRVTEPAPRSGLVHAEVGQIVTFFVYRPPSRPLGSLTLLPSPGGSLTRLKATLGRLALGSPSGTECW